MAGVGAEVFVVAGFGGGFEIESDRVAMEDERGVGDDIGLLEINQQRDQLFLGLRQWLACALVGA